MSRIAQNTARHRLVSVVTAGATVAALGVGGASVAASAAPSHDSGATATQAAQANRAKGHMSAPINFKSDQGSFRGRFVPHRFSQSDGQLMVTGDVVGTVVKKGQSRHVRREVTTSVQQINGQSAGGASRVAGSAPAGSCDVLNLVLGPLDLNLLGLEVHLNTVVLDIVATPAGGLLGQLLCSVANLLNGGPLGGLLTQLTGLLNQILGQLGALGA